MNKNEFIKYIEKLGFVYIEVDDYYRYLNYSILIEGEFYEFYINNGDWYVYPFNDLNIFSDIIRVNRRTKLRNILK